MASAAFARISRDVTRLVEQIPSGAVTTYGAIGKLLDLPARHVAYALLHAADRDALLPWHRVTDSLGKLQKARAIDQAMRLGREGVPCTSAPTGMVVADFCRRCVEPDAASADLEAVLRPAQYRKQSQQDGECLALADTPGLGKRGLERLVERGITSLQALRGMDPYRVYAQVKQRHSSVNIQFLFVLIAAAEKRDLREVAKSERTAAILRLEDMGLL
jgi:alkylated DNA nucleotide flippase Atl1